MPRRFLPVLSRLSPIGVLLVALFLSGVRAGAQGAGAQGAGLTLDRGNGATVMLQPYGPNVVRVTMSLSKAGAEGAPGPGFVAQPAAAGWTEAPGQDGGQSYRSSGLVVTVGAPGSEKLRPMPLDAINNQLRDHYFPNDHRPGPHNDELTIATADGTTLLTMRSWAMTVNRPGDPTTGVEKGTTYHVSARFDAPADEHYYGLGQHQQGFLDLRDHRIECWHNYGQIGGQTTCVPFMVSSRGYGILWDNASKTTIDVGFNGQNVWSSVLGDRVSFFVIAGKTPDEIYAGYRQLTGVTHLLPKAVYGYIQSKAIYPSQEQLLAIAKGYRDRHVPADVLVVDFLNMTRQGEMDLDPARWPHPAEMNDELHRDGWKTLLSVWPHFSEGTRFYSMLDQKGWLIRKADGTPDAGGFAPVIGPNIDTTNPDAARWWWEQIRDRYIKPMHFDYVWLDETEPDIDPEQDIYAVGSGARFYNVYPLFHTASVYEGFRRDFGDSRRCMILARAAYTGAQRNCTVFWSSDIQATWDMLRRSIPTGLNFVASGMPYWDTDIAGFFSPQLPPNYKPAHTPLIDPSDARENVGNYLDYPELFVRWFEWGAFQPVMRAHGERMHNEIWAYGKQAEPILAKYLRLRYQLLPYTYSLAYASYKTGAPYMRALWMDFPHDAQAADIPDEYMFGPALLVAPVTEQGATEREVYLPAGADWYNYWTNERVHGGQTIKVQAPIDTLPLFVKAGSIVPLGSEIEDTEQPQTVAKVKVYPGADGEFALFSDDGNTYDYEKGAGKTTMLHWSDASGKLTHTGAAAWTGGDGEVVEVVGSAR